MKAMVAGAIGMTILLLVYTQIERRRANAIHQQINEIRAETAMMVIEPPIPEAKLYLEFGTPGATWTISTEADFWACSDEELANIGAAVALIRIGIASENKVLLYERLLPERFKVDK